MAKRKTVRPYSSEATFSALDRRTKAGRVISAVEADLATALGGDPTPQQMMLIRSVAVKYARLLLLEPTLFEDDGEKVRVDLHHALAWSNSMRLDLQALGLERRARDVSKTASDVLSDHFARPPQTIEGALAA